MFKKFSLAAVLFVFVLSMSSVAFSQTWYTNCSIQVIGTLDNGDPWVRLTDVSGNVFNNKTFTVQNKLSSKTALATILTAMSLGKNVSVYANQAVSPGLIYHVVILNN
jgi:hypothetical protein